MPTPIPALTQKLPIAADDLFLLRDTASSSDKNTPGSSISRFVMNTAGGTTGDAGYFAKLATYTLSTANGTIGAIYELNGTNKATAPICRFRVRIRNGETGINLTNTVVEILELSDESDVSHNNFFITLATDGLGVNIELYVKKNTTYGKFYLTEVSLECEEAYTVAYNNGAPWSATDPTSGAAASKTSDWSGKYTYTPTISFGGASVGVTYTKQVGFYEKINGLIHCFGEIILSNKGSSTGQVSISVPLQAISDVSFYVGIVLAYSLATATITTNDVKALLQAATSGFFIEYGNGTGYASLQDSDLNNASTFRWDIWYRA